MLENKNEVKKLCVEYVPISSLHNANYNPRFWDADDKKNLAESISRFGIVDPILVNSAENRKGVVIGGNFRLSILKELNYTDVPVVYINIPDIEKHAEIY